MWKRSLVAWLFAAAALGAGPATDKKDRAKKLFEDVCTSCHTLDRVKTEALSTEDWRGLIKGMVSEGAALTDEEFSMIVDYLAKNFGEKKDAR
jgi:mono/diheme cytochrome c family protein